VADRGEAPTILIRPTRSWFAVDLAEIWRYRDLLYLLVYRDFSTRYKQTVLGPLWFVLQPLLTTVVFTIVFGRIAAIPTDGLPPMLFYLAGLLAWTYFSLIFQSVSTALVQNAGLYGKVYFPRLIIPLSAVASNSVALLIQLGTFLAVWAWFRFLTPAGASLTMGSEVLWFPLVVAQIAALSLGVGLWLSALTAKYRDFTLLSSFLVQLWMYATPIIYPFSQIPDRYRWLGVINPMTMPVEATKRIFLGQGVVTPSYVAVCVGVTLALLLTGVLLFNRVEKTFVDTV
jgi:lipopolysaccharide transport system permease protein